MVGRILLPMLTRSGHHAIAYSRHDIPSNPGQVEYRKLTEFDSQSQGQHIANWICLAPIWTLHEHFQLLSHHRAERIVALSSTSILTKQYSADRSERKTAEKLANGERELIEWAEGGGIEWVILRPTLIYGKGQDRNICEIARFISRFGFFPLLGRAEGRRQPVHGEDVAAACAEALLNRRIGNHAYELSGAESLSYRDMVARIFKAMDRPERFIHIPRMLFRLAIACMRILPRFRHWSVAMADRMDKDLVFDHAEASRDMGYLPRPFRLDDSDLPEGSRSKGQGWI
jgi:nucleoside-diphosphate-sugar epimerase